MTREARATAPGTDRSTGGEFTMSDAEFDEIRRVIRKLTGISMGDSKRQLVYRRLSARLKATGNSSFREYLKLLSEGDPNEVQDFANAVTTNLTSFFRESHHFDFLANRVIPEISAAQKINGKRLRIWSAGCSTGEEPYSIAMTLRESMKDIARWDARVLCTDLDTDVVATAKNGVYDSSRVEKIADKRLTRWFTKANAAGSDAVRAKDDLRSLLTFKPLNLMHEWPMKGPFDVIFCRNVIIYFDKPTQRVLIDRFANILKDGGYLIIGHSESLFNVSDRFTLLGQTTYRKKH